MILLLLCAGISATLRGPSPHTLLVPQGVNATVQFTCSNDEDLPQGTTRSWVWMVRNQIFTASSGVLIIDTEVVDGVTISTTLQISNVNEFFSSMIDTANITCIERLASNVINDRSSNITATLVTFGPLQQPTISHSTSSVLVQWMPPLLRYNLHYRLVIYPSNNTTLCLNSASNSTEYTVDPSALGDGCSTVNCTMYRVTVTAVGNVGEGQPATSEPFIFPTGTPTGVIC